MTDTEIKNIFKLQSRNVRYLKRVKKNMNMDINHYLIQNDSYQVSIKTKLYSLLYSALSEAQFIQILHTPNGFMYSEILKIQKERSIVDSWHLMLDLALNKVGDWNNNEDLRKRRYRLKEIINEYIEKPQILRNKIAHGQWIHALNSNNTAENQEITSSINELNVVIISIWFEVHQYLCYIIRDLVQSPKKGFHNNYWKNMIDLENFLQRSNNWTLEKRIESLKMKYNNRK